MRKPFVEPVALPEPRFRDGLGVRYVRTDGTDDPVEVLRPLWDVGAMQNAIRQRVGWLATFRQARFVPVRAAEIPRDDVSTIEVVSDYVSGYRLSQYLEASRDGAVTIETNTALYILRELLGALALLHESRGVTHGAVGPERILINPKGRVVVADYVLGPAIERLEFTRPRLWREFRIPLPAGKGLAKLDDKADVVQVGATALAMLLGRPIETAEYPERLEELLAAINQSHRAAGRMPVPAVLIGWLKRAVHKDPNGKFANVSEARLALESVISKQEAATGGAASLKALAEAFGRHAAALEAKASAAAAAEARKAALAAQAAAEEALHEQTEAAAAAVPLADLVPAFTLVPEPPAIGPQAAGRDAGSSQAVESDTPVGWRVPEPPAVEETLPTSPLIQIDSPAAPAPEEFIEEVLDLSGLAGADDVDAGVAVDLSDADAIRSLEVTSEAEGSVMAAAAPEAVVEIIVDLRELDGAEDPVETMAVADEAAPLATGLPGPEAVIAAVVAEEPVPACDSVTVVDAALAALEAHDTPASAPADALPEWRLLADPVGATAPTIDVEVPTESLEELMAEFAAAVHVGDVPAVVETETPAGPVTESPGASEPISAVEEVSLSAVSPPMAVIEDQAPIMEPPVAMLVAPTPFIEQPAEISLPVPQAAGEEPLPAPIPSVLDELLSLQDAQAAAQAAVDAESEPQVPALDIAAWSFVEELVHRDTRFDARSPVVETPVAQDSIEADPAFAEPSPVLDEVPPKLDAVAPALDEVVPALDEIVATLDAVAPGLDVVAPALDKVVPALPADWFIEVGRRPVPPSPAVARTTESASAAKPLETVTPVVGTPAVPVEAVRETTQAVREFTEAVPEATLSMPPVARRPELAMAEEDDLSGPVFPRVAPSVQRVRAEARRRRLARISSGIAHGFQAFGSACASGASAVAGGVVQVFSSAGRGFAAVGGAVISGTAAAGVALLGAIAGAARGAASGLAAVGRGAAAGGAAAARAAAAVAAAAGRGALHAARAGARVSSLVTHAALAGAGQGLKATASAIGALSSASVTLAGMAAKAAVAGLRLGAAALAAGGWALAKGLGALGRAGARIGGSALRVAAAFSSGFGRTAGRAAGQAARAATAAGGAAGRGAAQTGKGLAHVALTAPRSIYFFVSDVSDRLPKPRLRLSYLAVALLAIVAVAGVPYARARFFAPKPAVGSIRVEAAKPDAEVSIDGVAHGKAPVAATVPVGRHRIEVTSGGKTRAHDVEVSAGNETLVQAAGTDLKEVGSLRVSTDPDGAEVLVDGVLRGTSPLTVDGLAEGTHTILVRDESGSVRRTVRVRRDETAEATLQIRPGWLAVFAPVKLEIFENGRSIGSTERGRILAPPGPHTIEVASEAVGFRESRQVEIKPGEVVALTIQMPPATMEIVAPADSEILVDGKLIGQAPLGPVQVQVGTREITMRHQTLGERRQVISVTYASPARVVFE
jgi:hypothetical protein